MKSPRRFRSALSVVVTILAVGSVLVGCDRRIGLDDPVQARVADGELQFRVCTALVATSVLVQVRAEDDWEDVWNVNGTVELERGDVIGTSTLDDVFGSATFAINPDLRSGDEVAVILYEESGNVAGSFELTEAALSGEWIGTLNDPESSC